MTILDSINIAREGFILSLLVRSTCNGLGHIESGLFCVSLGPWSIGRDEIDAINRPIAGWMLEMIATQNMAIVLDTALEKSFPNRLSHDCPIMKDYFCFVRCLRNAFAHDPLHPKWDLSNEKYKRKYMLPKNWEIDLSQKHGIEVDPSDYLHAGGLIRLCDIGTELINLSRKEPPNN